MMAPRSDSLFGELQKEMILAPWATHPRSDSLFGELITNDTSIRFLTHREAFDLTIISTAHRHTL
ncbi:hypothetical protein IX83_04150 [Basilea psittacipulmonis DSM 24701]|uniref:Uncharacterized protein n=1 Tax=Basilea psittacipulmonis DSM 24701 TaxID=1072685 RepID=A0A077DEL3_9BURK|nr:hypothetical protein IX83_04150 [Basilea psittacipulmonis DSM 24701]